MGIPHPECPKILTNAQLLRRREEARRRGLTVVQCHGCFDIVHPGHVRHLRHAASQGDILLVTVTADIGVGKGVGRPLFPQDLRAENLAALDFVDWVYINPDPTAEALLEQVRPDVYVKGREYESNNDRRFLAEREAVERHGGRVVFSSGDVVFSSTALISSMGAGGDEHPDHDPRLRALRRLGAGGEISLGAMAPLVGRFSGKRVVVVGETILETSVSCDRPDVAADGACLSLRPIESVSFDGGAAAVAANLAALGSRVTLVTGLPETPEGAEVRGRLRGRGIDVVAIETEPPVAERRRFLVGAERVMALDLVRPATLDAATRARLLQAATDAAADADAAAVVDLGGGFLTPHSVGELCRDLRRCVRVLGGLALGRRAALASFRRTDLLFASEVDVRETVRDFGASLNTAAWELVSKTETQRLFTTLDAAGLVAFEQIAGAGNGEWVQRLHAEHAPHPGPPPLDPLGMPFAGFAAALLTLVGGGCRIQAAFAGAVAGSAAGERIGLHPISAGDLLRRVRVLDSAPLAVETAPTLRSSVA